MTTTRIETLRAEEGELVFPAFGLTEVWRLGARIVERAMQAGFKITVDIRKPGAILFRAALPGSTPDQQFWVDGKSATALRLERSTAVLEAEFGEMGFDPASIGWLPREQYVLGGGSVPIRVSGVGVVAVATVSGLASDEDHDLVTECLRELLAEETTR
ncbi:hypothetical protein GCM10017608_11130 [Agromyces luteolus]|uniref:Heme-degrading domain-containing protein n=2 Tax=Agromyces luteolus TaxID=88373 RepID=A0A7C9I1V8_9MICO|nr:hypothetical protein [Agromyces luteolus]GLK27180.1 hypothetical protein GCM10017608_11130 [Agromyces luteolus]